MPFSTLGLSPSLCTPLAGLGYAQPTPRSNFRYSRRPRRQRPVGPRADGHWQDCRIRLPMIDRLLVRGQRPAGMRKPRGLVLVPTRELAQQVHQALRTYGAPAGLRITAIFGGVPMRPQVQTLQRGLDIIVATPGRLIDHLQRRTVDLSAVEILTLDEADRMLDMGFLPPLRRILAALPRERQTLLLSATFSKEVVRLSGDFTRNPVRVDASTLR